MTAISLVVNVITSMLLVQLLYMYVEKKKSFWLLDFVRAVKATRETEEMLKKDLGGDEDDKQN